MTFDQLKQTLIDKLAGDHFLLAGTDLASSNIQKMFEGFFPVSGLSLNKVVIDAGSDYITVSGYLDDAFLGIQNLKATATFEVVDSAEMSLSLSGFPTDWKFSQSLDIPVAAIFDAFVFSNPEFTLNSQNECFGTLTAALPCNISGLPSTIPFEASFASLELMFLNVVSNLAQTKISIGDISALICDKIPGLGNDCLNIPDDFPTDNINLEEFGFGVNRNSKVLWYIYLILGIDARWNLFQDQIVAYDMKLKLIFNQPEDNISVGAIVFADVNIYGITIDGRIAFPEKDFSLSLAAGSSIEITPIIESLLDKTIDMPEINCSAFALNGNMTDESFTFFTEIDDDWKIDIEGNTIALTKLQLQLWHQLNSTNAKLNAVIDVGETSFYISAFHTAQGWIFEGGTMAADTNLSSFAQSFAGLIGVLPSLTFPDITVQNLWIKFSTIDKSFHFSADTTFATTLPFGSGGANLNAQVQLESSLDTSGKRFFMGNFTADFTLANLDFKVKFDFDEKSNFYLASYTQKDGNRDTISLKNLVSDISADLGADIPDIVIGLKDIKLIYYKDTKKQFAIALDLGTTIDLCNLPLIGHQLPPEMSLTINNLQLIYASQQLTKEQIAIINPMLPSDISPFSAGGIAKGVSVAADADVMGTMTTVNTQNSTVANPAAPLSQQAAISTPSSSVQWLNIQKQIGPVRFNRIGAGFDNSKISFLLDAMLLTGGLSFSLDGLSVSSPLTAFEPSFNISGLGINFNEGGIEIGGSFLKMTYGEPPVDEYNGVIVIKAEGLCISAMGSYSTLNAHPSLFVYAFIDQEFGGPSFFFVEGLAIGFGYNRSLIMPSIDQVINFPLIAQVMSISDPTAGKSPMQVLNDELTVLEQYVPPTIGEMFIAVGVKFNTFKLIDSFALLAVSFGTRIEIDLLGQSNVVVPIAKGEEIVRPLAVIKILLIAKYIPDEGFLSVVARLSSDSYIFDQGCHLTGGAALYSWFKGEHEGDFVVTMGGYHPSFSVPAHYPQVPRLALNWQITNNLSIKGDMYFALCSHAFMAGGHLEALFSSGDFHAWFKAGADFLVTWQPYHYQASLYIEIGASLHVDLWICSFTVRVNYGADLEIWGPDFSGRATIHIYVCDITICFGASNSTLTPLKWQEFTKSCLPLPNKALGISISNGVHGKEIYADNAGSTVSIALVNPKEFVMSVSSMIPVKNITVLLGTTPFSYFQSANDFGAAPMQITSCNQSDMIITLLYNKNRMPLGIESITVDDAQQYLSIAPTLKKVPAAIWGTKFQNDLNEKNRMITINDGISITAVEPIELPVGGIDFPTNIVIDSDHQHPLIFKNIQEPDFTYKSALAKLLNLRETQFQT